LQQLLAESDEREITLGVGKLVGLFFLLVICCALCFAVGYSFGRGSAAKQPPATPEVQPAATPQAAKPVVEQPSGAPPPAPPPKPAPPPAPVNTPALSAGIMVQVAAVTKREDAEVLQDALRRKQYPVIIATAPSDRLFHVQVGPFSDAKEAESTRSRLQADGYNPILKR